MGHTGRMLTVDEFADMWGVKPALVYRLAQNGEIAAYKIGRVWRVDPDESMEIIKRDTRTENEARALGYR